MTEPHNDQLEEMLRRGERSLRRAGRLTLALGSAAQLLCLVNVWLHIDQPVWAIFWALLGAYNCKNVIQTWRSMQRWGF